MTATVMPAIRHCAHSPHGLRVFSMICTATMIPGSIWKTAGKHESVDRGPRDG